MSLVLVTGGAGYVGSHVVKELLRKGYQPLVYDNLQSGHRKAVKGTLLIEEDLSDRENSGRLSDPTRLRPSCISQPLVWLKNRLRIH